MSEPMTNDLQHAFDDLVGDARPGADLAARARVRGTTLRRQRMAGGLAVVAVTGALCVPGLALVRDQAQGGSAGAPVAGQPKAPAAAADKAKAARTSTSILADEKAKAAAVTGAASAASAKEAAAAGAPKGDGDPGPGSGPTNQTVFKSGVLTAADNARVAAAQALLGGTYTLGSSDIAVDVASGATVGAAVTFVSASGKIGIEWSTGEHSTAATSATIGPKQGTPAGSSVVGAVLVRGTTEWDVKILPTPGRPPMAEATPTAAAAFLDSLATASS